MNWKSYFNEADVADIERRGISLDVLLSQLKKFRDGIPPIKLKRPATIGDGIQQIPEEKQGEFISLFQQEAQKGRFLKFVPASGAATRMMKTLVKVYHECRPLTMEEVTRRARDGDSEYQQLLTFFENLPRFAFYEDLKEELSKSQKQLEQLIKQGQLEDILATLLLPGGLNYAQLPKGLIKFHRYPDGARTAFEEHLVEALNYAVDSTGHARVHFTVNPHFEKDIREYLQSVSPKYEGTNHHLEITYSFQKPSTDTIAVDLENRPLRDEEGRLIFRPGGHGALLENLNDLKGDIIFIKNIDNVVPDRLKPPTFQYKKVLAGYLIWLQRNIYHYLEKLTGEDWEEHLNELVQFIAENLNQKITVSLERFDRPEERRNYLFNFLNRPIRVCGMVKNEGEPGGGPFWVEEANGEESLQIVESAEVDLHSPDQLNIWKASTHFNPVDLVCGVRDYQGNPFNLLAFTNPESGIITRKSLNGQDIKALELPGLWNGGMAKWITVFVEVPIITFNPVKTIFDLLRAEHQ